MNTNETWIFLKQIPTGHKFFIERSSGRIAIADNSGEYPDETNDGVLYLDFTRMPRFSRSDTDAPTVDYPLVKPNNKPYWTVGHDLEVVLIAWLWGLYKSEVGQ